jgi:hypothetical protein
MGPDRTVRRSRPRKSQACAAVVCFAFLLPRLALADEPAASPDPLEQRISGRNAARDAEFNAQSETNRKDLVAAADKAEAEARQRSEADGRVPDEQAAELSRRERAQERARMIAFGATAAAIAGAGGYLISLAAADRDAISSGGLVTGSDITDKDSAMRTNGIVGDALVGLGGMLFVMATIGFVSTLGSPAKKREAGLRFEGGALVW